MIKQNDHDAIPLDRIMIWHLNGIGGRSGFHTGEVQGSIPCALLQHGFGVFDSSFGSSENAVISNLDCPDPPNLQRPPIVDQPPGRLAKEAHRPMKDMQTHLERLRVQVAECEMIRDLATDEKKRQLFARLAEHFRILAAEIERAMK
ncbi:MAG: hypothetical protein WA820_01285 [Bradyrhizobium sp.]